MGSTAMLVTVAQYAIGPGALGLSLGYTALSGGVGILVIGPASEGLSAIQAQDSGEGYRFGRQI